MRLHSEFTVSKSCWEISSVNQWHGVLVSVLLMVQLFSFTIEFKLLCMKHLGRHIVKSKKITDVLPTEMKEIQHRI